MNIKKALICLSIAAVVTLCVPNVVAASANKQTTNVHSSYAMSVPDKEQPRLAIMLSDNVTSVNKPVDVIGLLATVTQSTPHPIEGATVTIQQLNDNGTAWNTLGTLQTSSTGKDAGYFAGSVTPKSKGYNILRATYDGDSDYAPAVRRLRTCSE